MADETGEKKLGPASKQSITIPSPPSTNVIVDYATLLGILVSFGLVITAIILGGRPGSFLDFNSFLIVIGGTLAVTLTSFSTTEFLQSLKVIANSVLYVNRDVKSAAVFSLKIAEINRRNGILALEGVLPRITKEHYLWQGIRLLVDGTPNNDVEKILQEELNNMAARHGKSVTVLRRAAEVAPAMGLIGTLIGLVQMLGNLSDPSTIGPAMAVALLTTFYGAIMANMFFLPLASKLERHTDDEMLINKIYIIAIGSIGRRDNPRKLENMMNAALPPAKRVRFFDQ